MKQADGAVLISADKRISIMLNEEGTTSASSAYSRGCGSKRPNLR